MLHVENAPVSPGSQGIKDPRAVFNRSDSKNGRQGRDNQRGGPRAARQRCPRVQGGRCSPVPGSDSHGSGLPRSKDKSHNPVARRYIGLGMRLGLLTRFVDYLQLLHRCIVVFQAARLGPFNPLYCYKHHQRREQAVYRQDLRYHLPSLYIHPDVVLLRGRLYHCREQQEYLRLCDRGSLRFDW